MSEKPSYRAAHNHLRSARGNASDHKCSCGEPAVEWAFQHVSSGVLLDPDGRAYSDNPSDYSPMCLSHHRKYDRAVTPERFSNEILRKTEDPATKQLVQAWLEHTGES